MHTGKSLVYKADISEASQRAHLVCKKNEKNVWGVYQHPYTVLQGQSQLRKISAWFSLETKPPLLQATSLLPKGTLVTARS